MLTCANIVQVPQQNDSISCGMHTASFLEDISESRDPASTVVDVQGLRNRIAIELARDAQSALAVGPPHAAPSSHSSPSIERAPLIFLQTENQSATSDMDVISDSDPILAGFVPIGNNVGYESGAASNKEGSNTATRSSRCMDVGHQSHAMVETTRRQPSQSVSPEGGMNFTQTTKGDQQLSNSPLTPLGSSAQQTPKFEGGCHIPNCSWRRNVAKGCTRQMCPQHCRRASQESGTSCSKHPCKEKHELEPEIPPPSKRRRMLSEKARRLQDDASRWDKSSI